MASAEEKFYRAQIVERTDIASDLWLIKVDPGGEFRFAPGQYCTLGVVTPEKHYERAYSIVSAPFEKHLEIFIELVPQGELTPLLYKLKVGDTLSCRKVAKGRFTLDTSSGRMNHLLLATVTGVAPFVSYARALYRQWKEGQYDGAHKLFLLEGASRSWELGYEKELQQYASEVPWLTYVPTVSRPWDDPDWKGETGRVDELTRKYTDAWGLTPDNTSGYICGHPSMIENTKGILQRRGWLKNTVKEEAFFIPGKEGA